MRKKFNYSREERFNQKIYRNSLWKKINDALLDPNGSAYFDQLQISFLQNCMNENLSHARHAEIERLTFNTILVALTAGVLSFITQNTSNKHITISICILMIGFSIINLILTHRWNICYRLYMNYEKNVIKHYALCCSATIAMTLLFYTASTMMMMKFSK